MVVADAIVASHVALWTSTGSVVIAVFQTLLVGKTGQPLPGTTVRGTAAWCEVVETPVLVAASDGVTDMTAPAQASANATMMRT